MTRRLKLFASHACISAAVVGAVAAIVLLVWYPYPLFSLQGAVVILALVAFVDVVIGPLITLIVASPKKGSAELVRDLAIIGIVQFAALTYGVHSLFVARPAFIVFNADRFDCVVANELVAMVELSYRNPRFITAPIFGPIWVAASPPDSAQEREKLLFSALQGGPDIKDIPALYEEWPPKRGVKVDKLKPLSELMRTSSEGNQAGLAATRTSGLPENELAYLPIVGREKIGVVILNRNTLSVMYVSDVAPRY